VTWPRQFSSVDVFGAVAKLTLWTKPTIVKQVRGVDRIGTKPKRNRWRSDKWENPLGLEIKMAAATNRSAPCGRRT
jgi:hypothetical protein